MILSRYVGNCKQRKLPMDIKSTLYFSTDSQFENHIRKTLKNSFKNEMPTKKAVNSIMSFAASYECIDTKIGKVELLFN